jgi:hypothetical protein
MRPSPTPTSELGPLLRDPATVASELLVDPSDPAFARRERPAAARWTSQAYLNDVNSALSRLRQQVVQLRADMMSDLPPDQRRRLAREADSVLGALDDFGDGLRPGRRRTAVAEDYAAVQARVRALARDARAAGLSRSASDDSAGWVAMADQRLDEAVSRGGGRDGWEPALVARDSDNQVFLARDLDRQGEYGLSAAPGRRTLQDDLHALTHAAEFFRASVASGAPRRQLARDFETVEEVWGRVAPALARLNPAERQLLMPRARRVQDVILKLHERLGLAGTPRRLDVTAEPSQPARSSGPVLPASAPR